MVRVNGDIEMLFIFRKPILFALISLLFALPAAAEKNYDQYNDRFRIYAGGFWPSLDSSINVNGDVLPPGPPISIEDTLGVEDSKGVAWGGIEWRISRRNYLEFEAFSLKRDGGVSGTFEPPIQIDDFYIVNGSINTQYDTSVGRVTYGFAVIQKERMDLQLKIGLHLAKLDAGFSFSGDICYQTTTQPCPTQTTGTTSEDVTAPLPHLGASFSYAITPTIGFRVQAIGFALELDNIDGSMIEISTDVSWQPWRHFGLGAGLRYFNVDVDAGNSTLNGEFDFEYFGPTVYIQTTF
jgi:hypothetical protein